MRTNASVSAMRTLRMAVIVAPLVVSSVTEAAEDEAVLAVEPGYALLTRPDLLQHGGQLAASAWLGMNDEIWLTAGGGIQHHLGRSDAEAVTGWEVLAGLALALDVLRTIPFVEAMLGVVGIGREVSPTVRLGIGADYLIGRTVSLGGVFRFSPLADEQGESLYTASFRIAYRLEL